MLMARLFAPTVVYHDFVFHGDSLKSQASSSGLCHSLEGISHSPSLKMMDGL